jgi:hypothetical protein
LRLTRISATRLPRARTAWSGSIARIARKVERGSRCKNLRISYHYSVETRRCANRTAEGASGGERI